jgi:hypothetical protein
VKFRLEVFLNDGGGKFSEGSTDDDLAGALQFLAEWRDYPGQVLTLGSSGPDGISVRYADVSSARLTVEA